MESSSTRPAGPKERERPDNILYSDDSQSTASNTSEEGTRTPLVERGRESSPKPRSKPRGPPSLTGCTLDGGGKRASGACFAGPPMPDINVQAANANGSVARETGALKSKLGSQAFRIMDELSRAWGWAADKLSPQPIWAAVEGPSARSKSPSKMPATESLYILNPHQNSSACYLYRSDDDGSSDSYEFEHVPVKVVHGFGQSAYLIAISDKDSSLNSPGQECTPGGPRSERVRKGGKSTTKRAPSGNSIATGPGFDAEPSGRDDKERRARRIDADVVDAVMRRVREQLLTRDQRRAVFTLDDAEERGTQGGTLYLVSDSDVSDAVKLAMTDAFKLALAGREPEDDCGQTGRSSTDTGKSLSTSSSLPRLDSQNNTITPCSAAAASPATTISVPKASFSSLGRTASRSRSPDLSIRATVVSRGSVADIFWTENEPVSTATVARAVSDVSSSLGQLLPPGTYPTEMDGDGYSLRQFMAPGTLDSAVDGFDFSKRGSLSTDEESNMTSFPELRPRHCTNDWLNPPVAMEQLIRSPSADLYQLGVDAHCGGDAVPPPGGLPEPVVRAQPCGRIAFNGDPFSYAGVYASERRATEGAPSAGPDRRLGASIGSASRRRRSSHVPDRRGSVLESYDGLLPAILGKLRRSGQKMLHRHECPRESDSPGPWTPANTPETERRLGTGPRSRDSIIRERTPVPPRPDLAGIYEAMTGSRMLAARTRHDACSEDYRPHRCENDMDSCVSVSVASPA